MREDGSSSPSANPRILSIELRPAGGRDRTEGLKRSEGLKRTEGPSGTSGERWQLELSDGSCFFVSTDTLRMAGVDLRDLIPGVEIEASTAARLQSCVRELAARAKALELLARRAHSVQELRLKLVKRQFEAAHIDAAVVWLQERGYLDDRGFAREWVERRAERHPEGRLALIAGLRRKGVSRAEAEEAVHRLCTPESERAAAEAALARLVRRGGPMGKEDSDDRLRRALQRRGFRLSLVLEVLAERRTASGSWGGEEPESG